MARIEKKFKKKKLGSYPFVSVVFSITLALFVIGIFGLLLLYTNKLKEIIQENVEVQVYLNKQISENDRVKIQKTLSDKNFLLKTPNQTSITYISKEEAAQQFIEETGEDFVKFLGDNPLRDLYVIQINPDYHSTAKLKEIKSDIESIFGVYNVVYSESIIESINDNLAKVSIILLCFAALLLGTVVILINNTIKLALFSQRFLIRSMQLVGATSSFIQRPFLVKASFHGFIAGVIAIGLLYLLLTTANSNIQDLDKLQDNNKLLMLMVSIILTGILVGFLSTYIAMRKYLKMSLDELY